MARSLTCLFWVGSVQPGFVGTASDPEEKLICRLSFEGYVYLGSSRACVSPVVLLSGASVPDVT